MPEPDQLCDSTLTISTKRLILRRPTIADITDEYIHWLNNPEVNSCLEIRHHTHTRESCEAYINMRYESPHLGLHFGVFDQQGTRFVGTVTFNDFNNYYKTADISFVIGHPQAQHIGYATEAVKAACHFAFHSQGLFKLTGGHYTSNIGSLKVFQKNGFHIEGVRRAQTINAWGKREDSVLHGLLATEFDAFHNIAMEKS